MGGGGGGGGAFANNPFIGHGHQHLNNIRDRVGNMHSYMDMDIEDELEEERILAQIQNKVPPKVPANVNILEDREIAGFLRLICSSEKV